MTRIKNWFAGLSDQWRATLRTAWQSFVGGLLGIVLLALNSAIGWVNGEDIDIAKELSNLTRMVFLLILTTFSGLVAYVMNRGTKGASYPPPPPPAAPPV